MTRARATANVLALCVLVVAPLAWDAFRHRASVVALAVALAVSAVLVWRAATIRVDEDADGLLVRNVFRTRRVRKSDVTEVRERRAFLVSSRGRPAVVPVVVTGRRRVALLARAAT